MSAPCSALVDQFILVAERLKLHEENAEADRWALAELAWQATSKDSPDRYMTQAEFGQAVGSSQHHISYLSRAHSDYHRGDISFAEAYARVKAEPKRPRAPKPAPRGDHA